LAGVAVAVPPVGGRRKGYMVDVEPVLLDSVISIPTIA
jgi:hypothetical protein